MRVQFSRHPCHVSPYVGSASLCAVITASQQVYVEHMAVILASGTRTVGHGTRDVHLGLRCTPSQRQALQERAQARGQTVSTYLLSVALEDAQTGAQSTD